MTLLKSLRKLTPIAAACAAPLAALATNGMNMEGYGPISTGLGGASQAIDHGTAAMAQNPATLSLMGPGARFDAAFGIELGAPQPRAWRLEHGAPTVLLAWIPAQALQRDDRVPPGLADGGLAVHGDRVREPVFVGGRCPGAQEEEQQARLRR